MQGAFRFRCYQAPQSSIQTTEKEKQNLEMRLRATKDERGLINRHFHCLFMT